MLTRVLLVEFDEYRCGSRDDLRHGGKRSVNGRRHDGKRSSVPAERSLIDRARFFLVADPPPTPFRPRRARSDRPTSLPEP